VLDFSAGGARLECTQALTEGDTLTLMVEAIGTFSGTVIWRGEGCFGVRFDTDASKPTAISGTMVPTLTPLGIDASTSERVADAGPSPKEEPGAAVTDVATCEPPMASTTPEISADAVPGVSEHGSMIEEPSAVATPAAPKTETKQRRTRALKVKTTGEDVFTLPAGQLLFQEGDPGGRMYLVRGGTLRIQGASPGEEEEVGRGGVVGEMELLERGLTRRTTVLAVTECELMEIDARRFKTLIEERPDFALAVMHALSGRLRHMGDLMVGNSLKIATRDHDVKAEHTE